MSKDLEVDKDFICKSCLQRKQGNKKYLFLDNGKLKAKRERWYSLCPECLLSMKYTMACSGHRTMELEDV